MTLDQEIQFYAVIGTFCAVIVGLIAIYFSNKNTKKQIIIGKLEELYETIQILGSYYELFKHLYSKILIYRDEERKEIQTLNQYYTLRNEIISNEEKDQVFKYISRIEVLTMCYTEKTLQKDAIHYNQLMLTFIDLVYNGGSIQAEIHFKEGFPDFNDFYNLVEILKKGVISKIRSL